MNWFSRWFHPRKEQPAHLEAGLWGEDEAAHFLQKKGIKILGRRVRLGPREELDVVARDGNVLVFIEVKTRRAEDFGRAASAVDRGKRQRLSRAAMHYMRKLKQKPEYLRFDIVEVVGDKEAGDPVIRHIENAFTMDARYRLPW